MSSNGLRQSKKFLRTYDREKSKVFFDLSKNNLRIVTGFLTEHCLLNEHLSRLKLRNNGECRFCGEYGETPEHLITECAETTTIRAMNFGTADVEDGELASVESSQILAFIKALRQYDELKLVITQGR